MQKYHSACLTVDLWRLVRVKKVFFFLVSKYTLKSKGAKKTNQLIWSKKKSISNTKQVLLTKKESKKLFLWVARDMNYVCSRYPHSFVAPWHFLFNFFFKRTNINDLKKKRIREKSRKKKMFSYEK